MHVLTVWLGAISALGCAVAWCNSDAFAAAKKPIYKLLKLHGEFIKWPVGRAGRPRIVRWTVVSRPTFSGHARNCRGITSPKAILAQTGLSDAGFVDLTRRAFAAWSATIPMHFVYVSDHRTADIQIGEQIVPRGIAYADVSRMASRDVKGMRAIARARICFNPQMRWKVGFDGDLTRYDVYFAVLHEIGHALGLDHPNRSGQVMSWKYDERVRRLQAGDLRGLQLLYRQFPNPSRTADAAVEAGYSLGLFD